MDELALCDSSPALASPSSPVRTPGGLASPQLLARCCRICLEGEDEELGHLFAPCRCAGSMRLVHAACLERWRASAPGRASYYRCDTCLYEYKLRRACLGRLLLAPSFARLLAGCLAAAAVLAAGFLRGLALREGRRCTCVAGTPEVLHCPVHERSYLLCVRIWLFFRESRSRPFPERVARAARRVESRRTFTILPVHLLRGGLGLLSPAGVLLYLSRKVQGTQGARRMFMLLFGALVTSMSSELRQEAAVLGGGIALRELCLVLQLWARRAGQRLGERVLEVSF